MRITYSDFQTRFLDATGNSGSTNSVLLAFFKRQLGTRYQIAQTEMSNYVEQYHKAFSTVVGQQFYPNPCDLFNFEAMTITLANIAYPLECVSSQLQWDQLNQTLITTTTIPQFYFPRRDDFGVWPIPQAVYTGSMKYHYRNRNLTNSDYTSGTVSVTTDDATITGTGTFTADMVGRWFMTDGYWYRIATFTDATHLELDTVFQGTTGTGLTYVIGETPELPPEGHEILLWGAIADFYGMYKKDQAAQIWWNNMFWTGDGQNSDRTGRNIQGGLIGLRNRYASRSDSKIIRHRNLSDYKNTYAWSQKIV